MVRDVPGEQIADALVGVLGDAAEDVAQIGLGIEVVELGALGQGIDRCGALAARIRSGEQIILVADCDRAERSLGRIVVERGADPLLR